MNQFIQKLDSRYEKTKKPGTGSTVKRERAQGLPSTSSPPASLPSWMVDPSYKSTPVTSITTVCVRESSLDPQDPTAGMVLDYAQVPMEGAGQCQRRLDMCHIASLTIRTWPIAAVDFFNLLQIQLGHMTYDTRPTSSGAMWKFI